jgi:hypothetical protein
VTLTNATVAAPATATPGLVLLETLGLGNILEFSESQLVAAFQVASHGGPPAGRGSPSENPQSLKLIRGSLLATVTQSGRLFATGQQRRRKLPFYTVAFCAKCAACRLSGRRHRKLGEIPSRVPLTVDSENRPGVRSRCDSESGAPSGGQLAY